MADSSNPIGIFDSGLGGLTVFKAIRRRLPGENLIYFGDTAHVPYGSKSAEAVVRFSMDIAGYLASLNIKLLVVACNTASSIALNRIQKKLSIPVIGVIEPGARAAVFSTKNGRIGVIGTEATVASRAYSRVLKSMRRSVKVFEFACPLLVPLAEEGWWDDRITGLVTKRYLADFKKTKADTLILGCTHYPLLKSAVVKAAGVRVKLVDSAESVAEEVRDNLSGRNLLRPGSSGSVRFVASDAPARFEKLARRLLGISVGKVEVKRFD